MCGLLWPLPQPAVRACYCCLASAAAPVVPGALAFQLFGRTHDPPVLPHLTKSTACRVVLEPTPVSLSRGCSTAEVVETRQVKSSRQRRPLALCELSGAPTVSPRPIGRFYPVASNSNRIRAATRCARAAEMPRQESFQPSHKTPPTTIREICVKIQNGNLVFLVLLRPIPYLGSNTVSCK